ncbi:MAG: DNA integrity scanning protein DisA [Actinomyces sp.]|nr:MAG: DNA integrity scanning protein DisA [Actinomyces sp.]
MIERPSAAFLDALRAVAPGTALREGLDRILLGGKGALIVVGDGPEVLNICSGGFLLDAAFSPQRLSELAKMDGAIILAPDAARIARANVHLVPDATVPTAETGTRHRTAERVARSLDVTVVSVSEDMGVIAVYRGDEKLRLDPVREVLLHANQALQTLERYRSRLDEVTTTLSTLEVEDLVTLRDVIALLQRAEMVVRIAEEIEVDLVLLGSEGRQIQLQLAELMGDVEDERRLVVRDYLAGDSEDELAEALDALAHLEMSDLLDPAKLAEVLHLDLDEVDLAAPLTPHGHRLLAQIPRLPEVVADRVVERFGVLPKILRASTDDLVEVEGVGESRARAIREGLRRISQTRILDRFA